MTETRAVLLVEDHPAWNDLLALKLEPVAGLKLRARVHSMQAALALVEQEHAALDLMVVDVKLGDGSGLELIQICRQMTTTLHSIVLSAHDEPVYQARAWQHGAKGYLLKTEEMPAILTALERAAHGETLWDEDQRLRIQRWCQVAGDPWDSLTLREQAVVRALVNYCTDAEIATALNISPYTANNHLKRILEKLGLDNRREVSRWAVRYKVLVS